MRIVAGKIRQMNEAKRAIGMLVCLAGALAVAALHGQTQAGSGRILRMSLNSADATLAADRLVNAMLRSDDLRVRISSADTLISGRRVEQLVQYYKGARVWGGDVARQLDGDRAVSVFGTLYQNIDVDVVP